jgi:putative transposase
MSGDRYKITNQNAIHFLTFTIIDWIDLFSRKDYSIVVCESLNFCVNEKQLEIYSYVIMSNHVHIICKVNEPNNLSDVIRDFKKYTSKQFIKVMNEINESRRGWLLNKFEYEANRVSRSRNYKIWKDDNHAIEIGDYIDIEQKMNYIHDNPVNALIVENAEDYIFSSAGDYSGRKGYVKIVVL